MAVLRGTLNYAVRQSSDSRTGPFDEAPMKIACAMG